MTADELTALASKAFGNAPEGFSPLTDDGDSLRLAIDLQLGISIPPVIDGRIEVVTFYGPIISVIEYPVNGDRYAATRRAITRAAADIQMSKESK